MGLSAEELKGIEAEALKKARAEQNGVSWGTFNTICCMSGLMIITQLVLHIPVAAENRELRAKTFALEAERADTNAELEKIEKNLTEIGEKHRTSYRCYGETYMNNLSARARNILWETRSIFGTITMDLDCAKRDKVTAEEERLPRKFLEMISRRAKVASVGYGYTLKGASLDVWVQTHDIKKTRRQKLTLGTLTIEPVSP